MQILGCSICLPVPCILGNSLHQKSIDAAALASNAWAIKFVIAAL
ncbi:hypothetical protein GGR65_002314 [Xanthomonas sp. 3376]|nr:hypothetical protein [Xanthomonas arboricola]